MSKKILIIDDEPNIVTYLETLIQDNGYETIVARNGKEGFKTAKSEKPDLICLDISMPEESGIRFYRNLKDEPELKNIPVFVVTAVTGLGHDPKVFENFLNSRKQIPAPDGFFPKPIERDTFIAAIKKIL